jgi:hypothetical protein
VRLGRGGPSRQDLTGRRCEIRMPTTRLFLVALVVLATGALRLDAADSEPIAGDRIGPDAIGPSWIESLDVAVQRDRDAGPWPNRKARNGEQGSWVVPGRRATTFPRSGLHNVVNKWGDTRMGIRFPEPVDVGGAYFAGQAGTGVWAPGVKAIGYRGEAIIAETGWLRDIGPEPRWLAMSFRAVDRIEIVAEPAYEGGGWYGMDDLTYSTGPRVEVDRDAAGMTPVVIDFEDLDYRTTLTGSGHRGLTWERGTGDFQHRNEDDAIHAPKRPDDATRGDDNDENDRDGPPQPERGLGTTPTLALTFEGVKRGDAGSTSFPPDTDGAIGPDHYVITVNRVFAVHDKQTGDLIDALHLGSFLPGSIGDPRVVFDHHSGRWIVIVSDFSADESIYLAVSLSDDPTGDWFKTSFATDEDEDQGRWPDYPTLGVDANGIYVASFMVGDGGNMTIFAIDKAPLIAPEPSLGTITAFRELPWEGAIQPAHTYGSPPGQYFISVDSGTRLRMRRVNPPLTNPTLSNLGTVTVPGFDEAPNAPALGSATPLSTIDERLMMAVYRDGFIWTCHTIDVNGRAGCRWYQIDADTRQLVQHGTVADESLYYFFPSIMVDRFGDAVMAFSGSDADQYAAAYYTGRHVSDPAGEMATPVMFREGAGPQNNIDGFGRNRWGDYSYTTLDPVDEITLWTIQEYAHDDDIWGTQVAALRVELEIPDCNGNGVPDEEDIANGTSEDCNANGVPDECEFWLDCNGNGVPDTCDLDEGTSEDCNANGVPDECDIASGDEQDCNGNGVPDSCDIAENESDDCQGNGIPDECETDPLVSEGSGHLGPIGDGSPQSFTFVGLRPALGDVTLALTAHADLSSTGERIDVALNGVPFGETFRFASDCPETPNEDEIIIARDEFNDLIAGGIDLVVSMTTTQFVDPDACDDESYVTVTVGYERFVESDVNGNGVPDDCEDICRPDLVEDGEVNVLDLLNLLSAWGEMFVPQDITGDGVVDVQDLLALLAAWGACP